MRGFLIRQPSTPSSAVPASRSPKSEQYCPRTDHQHNRSRSHFLDIQIDEPVVEQMLQHINAFMRIFACQQVGFPEHPKCIDKRKQRRNEQCFL